MTGPHPASDRRPDPGESAHEQSEPHKHPRMSLAWKIFSIAAGSFLVLIGLVMLLTPGPGWLAIFGGLAMLSPHSRWAHAIMDWLKRKVRMVRKEGSREPPTAPPASPAPPA